MANLIKWYGPLPGANASANVMTAEQTHTFMAEFDVPPSFEDVYGCDQCPKFFDILDLNGTRNPNLFVVDVEPETLTDAPQVARVRVKYSNTFVNKQNKDDPNVTFTWITNPLLRPANIEWSTYTSNEAIEQCKVFDPATGAPSSDKTIPVCTTAGEPLILTEEVHNRRLMITKNVARVPDIFAENSDFINEDDIRIRGHLFKKFTLWLADLSIGNVQTENGVIHFPLTMAIYHNPKTWIRRVRNAGYFMRDVNAKWYKKPNGQVDYYYPLIPIRFSTGAKPDIPILLNKQGRPIQMVETSRVRDRTMPGGVRVTFDIQSPEDFGRAFTQEELDECTRYFITKPTLNYTRVLGSVLQ